MRGWFEFETGIKPSRREATLAHDPSFRCQHDVIWVLWNRQQAQQARSFRNIFSRGTWLHNAWPGTNCIGGVWSMWTACSSQIQYLSNSTKITTNNETAMLSRSMYQSHFLLQMSTDNDKNVNRWFPTEEWRPWQRKSKELTSWTQLTAWPAHLYVIKMSQTWQPTICVLGFLHKPEEESEVWSGRNCSKSCADECLSLIQVTKSYLAKMDLIEVKLLSFWMNIKVSCTLA